MEESIANYDEAFLVEHLVRKYVSLGVDPAVIGVITPYWAQVGGGPHHDKLLSIEQPQAIRVVI